MITRASTAIEEATALADGQARRRLREREVRGRGELDVGFAVDIEASVLRK